MASQCKIVKSNSNDGGRKGERVYLPLNGAEMTTLTGIRSLGTTQYVCGFYGSPAAATSVVYVGDRTGQGVWYPLNYPDGASTNLYGPDVLSRDCIRVVGSIFDAASNQIGCMYEGPVDGSGAWTLIQPQFENPTLNTICHSTAGGLVVGNYDTVIIQGRAFIYDIQTQEYINFTPTPNIKSITAYGIWSNGNHQYTIVGSYASPDSPNLSTAYIVDWNHRTQTYSHFTTYSYQNSPTIVTHFDGIGAGSHGDKYILTGDYINATFEHGFIAYIKRDCLGGFQRKAKWVPLQSPGQTLISGNSVAAK